MKIILLRHFESEKNVVNSFSSVLDDEPLTEKGRNQCDEFATKFVVFCNKSDFCCEMIHCTNSERAFETANVLAKHFTPAPNIERYNELKSISMGKLAGQNRSEVGTSDPDFEKNHYLYRKGLLNSYWIDENWNNGLAETRCSSEKRVRKCLEDVIRRKKSTLIVAHRSSITAILIYVARKMGIYPSDFFGYIQLDFGKVSILEFIGDSWTIEQINENI